MTNREAFRLLLPKYMKHANINQRELAAATGVSEPTVSCWISGRAFPRIDTIEKIAQIFGCDSNDLLATKELKFVEYSIPVSPSVLKILEDRIERSTEDDQLRKLWPEASPTARRAALAVLRSMKEGDD